MKKHTAFICIVSLHLLTALVVKAQSKKDPTLQPPPADVKVDGDLKEWGDSLRYYNEEKKLFYTIANDKTDIYITLRLADRMEQTRLLDGGLTISIDTKGKKKDEYTLTYPVVEAGAPILSTRPPLTSSPNLDADAITQAERDQLIKARLTKLRNIKATGFKALENDIITTTNTYGIKAAVNYDANGYLIYEASIPFKLFGEFKADKDEWSFNFKINGLPKANEYGGPGNGSTPGNSSGGLGGGGMSGGGMRGGGGGRRGGGGGGMRGGAPAGNTTQDRGELYKSIDFWEKFYLAPVK